MSDTGLAAKDAGSAERRLLLGAILVVAVAMGLLLTTLQVPTETQTWVRVALLVVVTVILHLVVRSTAPDADPVLLPLAVLLNGIGLVMVQRIDLAERQPVGLADAQLTWTLVGVLAGICTLVLVRSHRDLTRYHYTIGFATVVLLLLPLLPVIGVERNGSRLWVDLGPVGFQPGEFAKIGLVIFLAGYLERKRGLLSVATRRVGPVMLPEPRHLGPVLLATGMALAIVVLQRDLGSGVLFFGVSVTMLYVATGRVAYPLLGSVVFAIGGGLAWLQFGHVRQRVSVWLDPWSQLTTDGYQIGQATFAFGTGGLTGTGIGRGLPDDIPFAATDAIFAVIGEEMGLLGTMALLVVFTLLVARGYRIALQASDQVGTLLAAGLTTVVGLQVFVIIGGITRLVPFTGITLPFVSYGGSSLVTNYVLVALLLRVSHAARTTTEPRRARGGGS